MDVMPAHLRPLFKILPLSIQKIILSAVNSRDSVQNQSLFEVLTRIIKTEKETSIRQHPILQFLWGKLGYETSNYKILLELHDQQKTSVHSHPFVVYALHRSGKLDTALQLAEDVVSRVKMEDVEQPELIDALTTYQALLAGAQAAAYGEKLEKMLKFLNEAESLLNVMLIEKFPTAREISADLELELRIGQLFGNIYIGQVKGSLQIIEHVINNILPVATNDFLIANFWNLAGNTYVSIRKMDRGRVCFRHTIEHAQRCNDLRLQAVAKANLVNVLTVEAEIEEAIEVTKEALQTFEQLGDLHNQIIMMIVLGMLHVSQQDLPAAERQAASLLEIFSRQRVSPDSYLLGSMLFASVHWFGEAEKYLNEIKNMTEINENKRLHLEARIIEGIVESEKGNLSKAQQIFESSLILSDNYKLYSFSLDILINRVTNSLKYYLTLDDDRLLGVTWSFFEELRLLLSDFDLPSILVLQDLIAANLLAARFQFSEAKMQLLHARNLLSQHKSMKLSKKCENALRKISWAEEFLKSSDRGEESDEIIALLFEDAKMVQHYFARESLRMLLDLSVANLELSPYSEAKPILLLLITTSGLAIYTHHFQDNSSSPSHIDDQMISSFLTAISSFSQNIFGSGMLRTIQHENYFILLESITKDLYLVLIAEKESYAIRNKMRQFNGALKKNAAFLDQIVSKPAITMNDEEFSILENLCKRIFMDET